MESCLKRPLSAESSRRLLDLLCEDDVFRAAFTSDPTTALEEYGLQLVPNAARCAPVSNLASKIEFSQVRVFLQTELTRTASFYVPHFFETGYLIKHCEAA